MQKINYLATNTLHKEFKDVRRNFYNLNRIQLCLYSINNKENKPFLDYILYKYDDSYEDPYKNTLCFPFIEHDVKKDEDILGASVNRLKNIFGKLNTDYDFKGYIYENTDIYMFFKVSTEFKNIMLGDLKLTFNKYTKNDEYLNATISEILNTRQVINFKILKYVTKFFHRHPQFIYLYDEKMKKYEIPNVIYNGDNSENSNYRIFMGAQRNSSLAIFGPYYYFSQLKNALKFGVWDRVIQEDNKLYVNKYGKYKNGSLLRYAIFPGKMLVKMNTKYDEIDDSMTTKQMIKEGATAKKRQYISDRDGKWTEKNDSIYAGLHKDIFTMDLIAIKDIKNATLLSIHDLDLSKFPESKEDFDEKILDEIFIK